MKLKMLVAVASLMGWAAHADAQCGTTNVTGNLVPVNGDTLSGTYNVSGNFIVGPGVTVFVRPYASNGCGALEVFAAGLVQIDGTISAVGAGYTGGGGGLQGGVNNAGFIESCPAPTDQCGAVTTFGGSTGGNANPGGGGQGGANGQDGSGRKNQCQNFGDVGGRVGGSGGGGAGAGGSYGGAGTAGGNGGRGSLGTMSTADPTCTNHPIGFGFGGNGGVLGVTYGTLNGNDIDLGSGGGGAGGGGRGRFAGTAGGAGGRGGGLIRIESGGDFVFTGSILANGTNGNAGGNGGGAGPSPQCCSDLCDGVDEYTHVGAGGGGGGAGGGSGGGVLLKVGGIATITGNLQSNGGNGGAAGNAGAAGPNLSLGGGFLCNTTTATTPAGVAGNLGGAGSGGRIKVLYNICAPGNLVAPNMVATGGSGSGGNASAGTTFSGSDGTFVLGSTQPLNQLLCYLGDPGNLNSLPASGGYGGISYQWQSQTDCTGPWATIPGATGLNYDPPAGITDTTCYRLQVLSGSCLAFSDTLTVEVIPPQGASITPSGNVPACIGDTVPLTTSGGTGASYQWLLNGIPIPLATDSTYEVTATGAYSVQIVYPVGCAGLSAPVNVNLEPRPAAFVFVQGDSILCPGDNLVLQGFGSGAFQWQLNGSDIPGANGTAYTVTSAGLYTLEVTTAGGCAGLSDTVTITAGTPPVASLTPSGPLGFCAGDSVTLSAGGGNPSGWLYNGQPLVGVIGNSHTAHQSGLYGVVVLSPTGCPDTAFVMVASDTVVAGLNPAVNPAACVGDSALFLASGGGSYNWLYNQAPITDTTNFLFAGIPGDYTVIVTSPNGCVDTSLTYAFGYYPPVFPVASLSGSPFLCPGETLPLTGSAPGGISYQWLLNDTVIAGATSLSYSASSAGIYTLQATDQYGCDYVSPYLPVFPGANPVAEIQPLSELPICDGDTLVLLGSGGDSLFWYRNDLLQQSGTDTLFLVPAPNDGLYSLVVTTGCGMDSSLELLVGSGTGPVAGFYHNNLGNNEVEFVDQSISGATWLWDFGDGSATSTEQNPLHTYPGPGEWPVTMITWDVFGCSDTIRLVIEVIDPVFFIPNVFSPNEDGVNDEAVTNFVNLETLSFHIYDRWGKQVFTTTSKTAYWDGRKNGRPVPDGVYFYHLNAVDRQENTVESKGTITLIR